MKLKNLQYFIWGASSASFCFLIPKLLKIFEQQKIRRSITNGRRIAIVFGDSITQGGYEVDRRGYIYSYECALILSNMICDIQRWVARLSNWWIRKVDVVNAGFSGYNSREGLKIFQDIVLNGKPQFLTIFFGANDAVLEQHTQHVSLDEYRLNLNSMISQAKSALPLCSIILITPPPIWEDKLRQFNIDKGETDPAMLINRTNARAKLYGEVCRSLAEQWGVGVMDLWHGMEGESDRRADYLHDGLHLTAKGNDRLFEMLVEEIRNRYPDWLPDSLAMVYPHWSKLGRS